MQRSCSACSWLGMAVVLAFWLLSLRGSLGQAAATPGNGHQTRLAVAEFQIKPDTGIPRSQARTLVDLLTAQLSTAEGFELVERAALDQVLHETSLSLSRMIKPDQAAQVGKLLRADWFLLGEFLKVDGTNFVLTKIVDAQTGIVRDLTSVSLADVTLPATAEALKDFVVSSKKSVRTLGDRLFLAMGSFEDLGFHLRYPNFGNEVRAVVARHYQGSRVSVVERSQVRHLLDELRMNMGGLTEDAGRGPSAQPAFLLVDGLFQSFQDEQSKINMVLRLEPIGGRLQTVSLNELPGTPLEAKIFAAIDRAFSDPKTAALTPTREEELRVQINRGKELARTGDKLSTELTRFPPSESSRAVRVPVIKDAIQAFESALFLNPECFEAKFWLATCLADPQIGQRLRARDYWREVAASSTNAEMVKLVRTAIANSYAGEDDFQAAELLVALKREATDLEEAHALDSSLQHVYASLLSQGKYSSEALLEFMTEAWKTELRRLQAAAGRGERISVFWFGPEFYAACKGNPDEKAAFVEGIYSKLIAECRQCGPYLMSAYMRWAAGSNQSRTKQEFLSIFTQPWRKDYEDMLTQCERNPEGMLSPISFYSTSRLQDINLLVRREEYEFAERMAQLVQRGGRKHLFPADQEQLDFYTGVLLYRREQWREALALFERFGERDAPSRLPGTWGKGDFASSRRAAEACRRHLNLPSATQTNDSSGTAYLSQPTLLKAPPGMEIIFKVDGSRVWVANDTGLYDYDPSLGSLRRTPVRVPILSGYGGMPFNDIKVAGNRVWISTLGAGLIAYDPRTQVSTNYSVKDGLLTQGTGALLPDNDRLWISYGSSIGGGIGYFDLTKNRFVGMMNELPADLVRAPTSGAYSSSLGRGGVAPREGVADFALTPSGQLYASSRRGAFRYSGAPSNRWDQMALVGLANVCSMAASDNFLVLAGDDRRGGNNYSTSFMAGLLIHDLQRSQYRHLSSTNGLPNSDLRSVALDGDKAWVGGRGFLAVVNLPSAKIEKVCKLRSVYGVHCLELVGNEVWFCSGPGLYRMSKDAK